MIKKWEEEGSHDDFLKYLKVVPLQKCTTK